jgi:hypothetical protein
VTVIIGILLGVVTSGVTWTLSSLVSHPRLRWSAIVIERPRQDGNGVRYQAKLMNARPWSIVAVEVSAFLVLPAQEGSRVLVDVPVMESRYPVIGGFAFPNVRRARYGWMGASHRVVTIAVNEVSDDGGRLDGTVLSLLRSGVPGALPTAIGETGELLLVASATDGFFGGEAIRTVRRVTAGDVTSGLFERGRSLRVLAGGHPEFPVGGCTRDQDQ